MDKDSRKEGQSHEYKLLSGYVNEELVKQKNIRKAWVYGYNSEHDMVVISKDGTIGPIYRIAGLVIALPEMPKTTLIHRRSSVAKEQYWERIPLPSELTKIKSMLHWNSMPSQFKNKWVGYIEEEFDRREFGFWFMNNGSPTYITGSNYMYLQWNSIDIGYPDYREANRMLFLFWEACKADKRCYGMIYLKIRRSGFSYMASSEAINIGTQSRDARIGILSKTGADAKKMFTDKVVNMNTRLPFFMKPVQDGMDKPKTELSYKVPAMKITKKNMEQLMTEEEADGLNTTIDWRNTDDNSYDGEKLILLLHDESSKWLKPNNIATNWKITKTCLRLGSKIVGKCMMGSTANALAKGGAEYKEIYYSSDVNVRNSNGQTKSGLYKLFIPMEWNMEGFIDRYGQPVLRTPIEPVLGIDGEMIEKGAIDFWEAEVAALSNDPDSLNEYYRQFPRTESHAFRDESKSSIFNLTKIYQQIDFNDSIQKDTVLTRGSFSWKDGVRDSKVVWTPDVRGRFLVSWIPPASMQNNVITGRNGKKIPGNEHLGAFGCDPYDISATVDGRGSAGSLHGKTKYHMDSAPVNEFFLEYISRPQTAEIFFEDVLMACIFYGMPMLAENNKARLLYHFKNRGYREFSMNRPDKHKSRLSKTEIELGGIPNTSEDVKQAHASAIESYIEKYVGFDMEGTYRPSDEIGNMPFNRTLEDWAKFNINDRTKYDATISSGLAIMATQRWIAEPDAKQSKISINFARYSNDGSISRRIVSNG